MLYQHTTTDRRPFLWCIHTKIHVVMGRGKDGRRFHTGEQNTNFVSTLLVTNFVTLRYVLLSYLVTDTYFQLENMFKSAAFRS